MSAQSSAAHQECEVLVIGGSPAGSTIASLLAQRGRDVVLVEKEVHPRFHVGESLLPRNMEIFEQLGLLSELAALGVVKKAADFTDELAGGVEKTVYFSKAADKTYPSAFQVSRDELDAMLLGSAHRAGVVVHESTQVRSVDLRDDNVFVTTANADGTHGTLTARYLVDASGRDSLLARRMVDAYAISEIRTAGNYSYDSHRAGGTLRVDAPEFHAQPLRSVPRLEPRDPPGA